MPRNPLRSKPAIIITVFLFIIFASLSIYNYPMLQRSAFKTTIDFTYPVSAKHQPDGNIYVIDRSLSRIVCMTYDGKVNYSIYARENKEYVSFWDTAGDDKGRLFVYESVIDKSAFRTLKDRVRLYENGKFKADVFVTEYPADGSYNPHTMPLINSLCCKDGILSFSYLKAGSVLLYNYDINSEKLSHYEYKHNILYEDSIINTDYPIGSLAQNDSRTFVFVTRGGEIFESKDGGAPQLAAKWEYSLEKGGRIPWYAKYDDEGRIVVLDIISGNIFRLEKGGGETALIPEEYLAKLFYSGEMPRKCQYDVCGSFMSGVFGGAVWIYDGAEWTIRKSAELPTSEKAALWAARIFVTVTALFLAVGLVFLFFKVLKKRILLTLRQIIVTLPVFIISYVVLYNMINVFWQGQLYRNVFEDLKRYAEVAAPYFAGETIESINSLDDYKSAKYRSIYETMSLINKNNKDEWNKAYYIDIYKLFSADIYGRQTDIAAYVANSNRENSILCPMWEITAEKRGILDSGAYHSGMELNSTSFWAYSVAPIRDSSGYAVAFLEIGRDMSGFELMMDNQRRKVMLIALAASIILISLMLVLMSRITIRLSQLAKAHNDILDGNYKRRIVYKKNNELGDVIKGFNRMAEELESKLGAEEANRAKSAFLANMSHEIRTPMNTVLGMAELMPQTNLTPLQIEYLNSIKKTSRSLLQIINDILDFSKIEAGKIELIPVHFDIVELFMNVCSMCQFTAEQKNLEFNTEYAEGIPGTVYGDEVRVRQIITNITNNAIKYTRLGSVSVLLNYEYIREFSALDGVYYYTITVNDTGIGIREEDLPKLFSSFQQVDTKINRNVLGTGLGLAVTKRFVELMNGKITVESVYGKGSSFKIFMPLPPGDPKKIERDITVETRFVSAKPGVNILVVDDTPMNLIVAKGFLERHNIFADTAADGYKALQMLEEKNYDLVFMDHMMPGLDGIETTELIRNSNNENKNVPVVALTANAISGMREILVNSGLNDYITKPIESFELNKILLRWLPSDKIILKNDEINAETSDMENQIDLTGLNVIDEINIKEALSRLSGNKKIYKEMLVSFCRETSSIINDIRQLCKNQDWKNYAIKVHALKGMCSSIGAPELFDEAFALEKEAKDAAAENRTSEKAINKTEALCLKTESLSQQISELGIFEDEDENKAVRKIDRIVLVETLNMMRVAAAEALQGVIGATDRLDALSREAERMRFSGSADEAMSGICSSINDFDYEASLMRINMLLEILEQETESSS
ncbi:MAG: response regulator [Spirochaetaceae bacterium]|nr:response regulator [Spirochaetaceae bacterium]